MGVPIQQGYCFLAEHEYIKLYSYLLLIREHKFRIDNTRIPLLVTIPILSLKRQSEMPIHQGK